MPFTCVWIQVIPRAGALSATSWVASHTPQRPTSRVSVPKLPFADKLSSRLGVRVFTYSQIRPAGALRQLFSGAQPSQSVSDHLRSLRIIVLERANITAEWQSVKRAMATGNWGTSPERQRLVTSASTVRNERAPLSGSKRTLSLEDFVLDHHSWFDQVARLHPRLPRMHIYTESIIAGGAEFSSTMRKVFDFLQLTPLEGQLMLPPHVVAPDQKQLSRRVVKSRAHRLRHEQEVRRRERRDS